jgi:hypothetical protein
MRKNVPGDGDVLFLYLKIVGFRKELYGYK